MHSPTRHLRGRAALVLLVAVALVALVVSVLVPGRAAASPSGRQGLNPAVNIAPPANIFGVACRTAPAGTACETLLLAALNAARTKLGQAHYALPSGFDALSSAAQLLALVNSDRALYHRTPVTGMLSALNASAERAAKASGVVDPNPVRKVDGTKAWGWASNWAGGTAPMNSPLYAYYEWMYDDGFSADGSSNNVDCTPNNSSGCWIHRDNTLTDFGAHRQVAMGVGSDSGGGMYDWTDLFESFSRSARLPYVLRRG